MIHHKTRDTTHSSYREYMLVYAVSNVIVVTLENEMESKYCGI